MALSSQKRMDDKEEILALVGDHVFWNALSKSGLFSVSAKFSLMIQGFDTFELLRFFSEFKKF